MCADVLFGVVKKQKRPTANANKLLGKHRKHNKCGCTTRKVGKGKPRKGKPRPHVTHERSFNWCDVQFCFVKHKATKKGIDVSPASFFVNVYAVARRTRVSRNDKLDAEDHAVLLMVTKHLRSKQSTN